MISKEKIENGYIKNDFGILRQKFVEAAELHGFGVDWLEEVDDLDQRIVYLDIFYDVNSSDIEEIEEGYMLTLADFEEEEETKMEPKYKYTLVDMSPEEIYRAMLYGETFYVNEKEMYWNGNAFWLNCERVRFIDEDHQVCRRTEVKWQDEVASKTNWFTYYPESDLIHLEQKFNSGLMESERFLMAARVALRATGELR